jgi:hypothetical protein
MERRDADTGFIESDLKHKPLWTENPICFLPIYGFNYNSQVKILYYITLCK